jgi:hypothetical protein
MLPSMMQCEVDPGGYSCGSGGAVGDHHALLGGRGAGRGQLGQPA